VEIEEGIDGLVHISDMSWTKRVHHPSEVVKKGDKVQVVVLNMDTDNKRISLGMKQLIENPWDRLKDNYPVGIEIDCPIVRLLEKGVVVDLGNDIEGFVPISQLGIKGAVNNPADVLIIGDVLQLKVIEVDSENHRIVLAVRDMAEIKKLVKERLKAAQKSKAAEQEELATEIPAEEKVEVEEKAEPAAQTETAAVSVEEPTAQVPDQTAEKEKEQEVKEKKPKGETRKRAAKQQKVSAQENLSEEQDKVGEAKLEKKEETEPDRKEEVSSPELKADEKSDEESANVEKVENS
jgi:small subunit ribosomal protein S1